MSEDDVDEGAVESALKSLLGLGQGDTLSVLKSFVSSPRKFLFGFVATTILQGVFGVVTEILDGLLIILAGSEPTQFNGAGEEQLGLADIPVLAADIVIGAAGDFAIVLIEGIRAFNQPIYNLAGSSGVLSGVVVTAVVMTEIIIVLLALERIVKIALDVVQLGGLVD